MINHQVFTEPWSHKGQSNETLVIPQSYLPFKTVSTTTSSADIVKHTQSPVVTGTSVLGIKFKDGVMVVADNLASYGSMARFRDIERLIRVGEYTVVGVGGDISDLQYVRELLNSLTIKELDSNDGHQLRPEHVYEYLSRVMYNRRTKMNPLWNNMIIAGASNPPPSIQIPDERHMSNHTNGPFLASVDLLGTTFTSPVIATGMGSAMAIPLLRKVTDNDAWKTLTEEEARATLDECMKVLYYRDARSLNKFTVATITDAGVKLQTDQEVPTQWEFARHGYGYK